MGKPQFQVTQNGKRGFKPNYRLMLDGSTVRVEDAREDKRFTLSCSSLEKAKKTPDGCAIANEAKKQTGRTFEVYRNVAYERVSSRKVLRYFVPEGTRNVLMVNDLGHGIVRALEGFTAILKKPSECHTLGFLRSNARRYAANKSADRVKKGTAKRYKRTPGKRSVPQMLDLRQRALP